MNFYRLILKNHNETPDLESMGPKIYPRAEGAKISNVSDFFRKGKDPGKIHLENYVDQSPVFDFFQLYSITYKKEYDWILLDAYNFIGPNVPGIRGFLVSEKFKQLLEEFKIAKPSRFYPTKLMYQGTKLNYFIFHLAQDEWNEFQPKKSQFFSDGKGLNVAINSNRDLGKLIKKGAEEGKKISMDICLNQYSDLFYFSQFDYLVSEKLKERMEATGLIDFEFSLLDGVSFSFQENE